MKFSITTVLLLILSIAIALGWYVDRQRLEYRVQQLTESATKSELNGALFGRASALTILAGGYARKPGSFEGQVGQELIPLVAHLWRGETELDHAFGVGTAKGYASQALLALKCSDSQQFLDLAAIEIGAEKWPEFDRTTNDYAKLKLFVDGALAQ
ncbi:hypothetical protein N9Y42_06350 [Mariniblastus sp.]|nr:hypothetical protein [Mariniblastus sp.]